MAQATNDFGAWSVSRRELRFLDCLFAPKAISAIEITQAAPPIFMNYVTSHEKHACRFGVSQDNELALRAAVREDLGGQLHMVVDDASHTYEHTRRSFEILYPLLAPGGVYIIEDWAWAHWPLYQAENHPWAKSPALSNLVFELVSLLGSTIDITEIRITRAMVIIRKPRLDLKLNEKLLDGIKARGRAPPRI